MNLLYVCVELALKRFRVFRLGWAMACGAGVEFHVVAGGTLGFHRNVAEPLDAAESRSFGGHFQTGYTRLMRLGAMTGIARPGSVIYNRGC